MRPSFNENNDLENEAINQTSLGGFIEGSYLTSLQLCERKTLSHVSFMAGDSPSSRLALP